MNILLEEKVRGVASIRAPYYLCLYSEIKEGYLENAGFILQQMTLYLSSKGIGSCWMGIAKPPKEFMQLKDDKQFVIMLAFGLPAEPIHRDNVAQFKRKPLDKITDISDAVALLEPVRLAPSGINKQPWFFTGDKKEIIVTRVNNRLLNATIYNKTNLVDMGIALYHLFLSANHLGMSVSFNFEAFSTRPGFIFVAKAVLEEKSKKK